MDRLSESDPEEEYVDISDDNSIEIIPKIENDDDTQICIEEPIIVENSYVLYPIVGKEADGKFESKRRYREFIALRENLKCQWQGCYIPQIPPKVYIGNLWKNVIDQRKKLLESFLQKLIKIHHLYHSELVQCFLKSSQEIPKTPYKCSYFQLSQIYENSFPDYSNFIANQEHILMLENEKIYFTSHLKDLQLFKYNCYGTAWSFDQYNERLQIMYQGLKGVSKIYAKDKDIKTNIKVLEKNPYSILEDWASSAILDIEALIEAITCIDAFKAELIKIEENREEEKKTLYELERGNLGIFQMLTMKPKEYYIEGSKLQLNRIDKEASSLQKIINISIGQLLNYEIPKTKEGRENFESASQACLNLSVDNLTALLQQKTRIKKCFN
ncbi:unnamed protein product [Blepharisma stoltei]|uniref:PX domain-containing protein n=1 Tax=Blepharisma stoltei TaxID=1481888 RepID=A0AAU9KFT4_9CILI|nr:unnamed protein product [Blepharisma stoltei]